MAPHQKMGKESVIDRLKMIKRLEKWQGIMGFNKFDRAMF